MTNQKQETQNIILDYVIKERNGFYCHALEVTDVWDLQASIDSLFSDFKTIQSTSWSFGLLNDKVVRKNDSIGLVVHQPIRAESGSFDLRLPHYADSRGTIYYKDEAFSLKPNGREINYEVFYKIDVNKMKIRLSSIFIDEGGHLNQSSLEKIFMLELKSAI